MRRAIVAILVLALAALVVWKVRAGRGDEATGWRVVEVARGDLEVTVNCTGTLEPVTTVQVGTQVSGIVAAIGADFNDRVRAGQVIARIDTTLLASAVRDAQAGLQRARAERDHAEVELARIAALHAEALVSETELTAAEYARDLAAAGIMSAEVSLDRARRNLAYATITAPIDGTVIARSVEVGQTVQASFSAPELFQIAGDLTEMRILAAVDESDIGAIAPGQAARFTVQAYVDDTFAGRVEQVRLQSTVQENVVNYTVVIAVDNPDGHLLPGMTATVDIVTATERDVLHVPNAALRFRPDDAMLAALRGRDGGGPPGAAPGPAGGGAAGGPGNGAAGRSGASASGRPRDTSILWVLDDGAAPRPVPVRTGRTNGSATVIAPLRDGELAAGAAVIAGRTAAGAPGAAAGSSNPLQPQRAERRGPPGAF